MEELREKLRSILTTQELIVLGYMYALNSQGVSLKNGEIAKCLNVSDSRVVKIHKNCIKKLRRPSVVKLIKRYVQDTE